MRTLMSLSLALSLIAWGGDDDEPATPDAMAGAVCGDDSCNGSENCVTCATDCGACPPGCGDSSCNGTETCMSCPADCGVCACSPGDPNSCTGEQICVGTSCVGAFGRTYTISVYQLIVKTTDPLGDSWDAVGGAPDPYVVIALSGTTILTTAEVQDTFTPPFSDSVDVVIPAGAKFRFDAWDSDISDDDWIIGCEIDPLTANFLRALGPRCDGTVATGTDGTVLDILIVPK